MLDPSNKDKNDLPLTIRAVFIIGPDKKLKLSLNYPASVGRNMDEILRCVDALQLSAKHSVVSTLADVACLIWSCVGVMQALRCRVRIVSIRSPSILWLLSCVCLPAKCAVVAALEVCEPFNYVSSSVCMACSCLQTACTVW